MSDAMPINNEPLIVQEEDIALGQQVFRDFLQRLGADNNPGEYEGECCAIEAAARARIKATSEAIERAAKYHDDRAAEAERLWQAARDQGLEFANSGLKAAAEHRQHATAIRSLSIPGGEG